jgi:hypothetical protein
MKRSRVAGHYMTAITPITTANMPPDTVRRIPAFLVLGMLVDVTAGPVELAGVELLPLVLLVLLGVLLGLDALLVDETVDEGVEDEPEEVEELELEVAADDDAAEEAEDTSVDEATLEEVAEPVRPEMVKCGE